MMGAGPHARGVAMRHRAGPRDRGRGHQGQPKGAGTAQVSPEGTEAVRSL